MTESKDITTTLDAPWDVYKKGEDPAPTITVHASDPRPNVVFVLGGPGAGKGTMCELAKNQLDWAHLSAGNLLRAERAKGTPNAELINGIIEQGKLVPSEITTGLIKTAMAESASNNFLIDGFPRNMGNEEAWLEVVGVDGANVACCMFFECPLEVQEQRVLGRVQRLGGRGRVLLAPRRARRRRRARGGRQ